MTFAGKTLLGVTIVAAFGSLAWVVGAAGFGRWGSWSYYLFCAGVILLNSAGVGTIIALMIAIVEAIGKLVRNDQARLCSSMITLLLAVLAVAVAGVGAYFAMQVL